MDLVQVFFRDYVADRFFDVIVSRREALEMNLTELRRQVRQAMEVFAAAKLVGDNDAERAAFEVLDARRKDLARQVLKENGLGVSAKDEPVGQSKVVPAGQPRKG